MSSINNGQPYRNKHNTSNSIPSGREFNSTWYRVFPVIWILLVVFSLWWNLNNNRRTVVELARIAARSNFEKDQLYRQWAAMHGGVYVPVTEKTPPNPYLARIPERDITTPSGKLLTLMNPAYMTRQIHELGEKFNRTRGHITSLKPIRPGNAPDEWERKALEAFERGAKEFSSIDFMEGRPYLRFMRPLITKTPCLKCHTAQGYKAGDIRGGISVSVPMDDYEIVVKPQRRSEILVHITVLILGFAFFGIIGMFYRQRRREREKAEEELRSSEKLLLSMAENYPNSYVSIIEKDYSIGFISGQEFKKQNFDPEQFIGKTLSQVFGDKADFIKSQYEKTFNGEECTFELFFNNQYQLYRTAPLYSENGKITQILSVVENITGRRNAEEQIKASLSEKEILLKEIHHRVKNNMQVITSLLSLQSRLIDDENARENFNICENRIRSMALIHEELYQSENLSAIDYEEYLHKLVGDIFNSSNISGDSIKFVLNAKEIYLGLDKSIPCGLIITELVTNALKHAFPRGSTGEIAIGLKKGKEKNYVLTVKDNGIGIRDKKNTNNKETLGLTLIGAFVKQLKGKMEILKGNGTEVLITFPED